ncbi:MAG: TrbI/VirB10 family protein [Elusimicrobia bacterium]|nr:TrbI/VirB10 family protein [Elusimicrobiota bacterium]
MMMRYAALFLLLARPGAAEDLVDPTALFSQAAQAAKPAAAERPPACPGADDFFLPTGFTFPALLPDAIFSYNTAAPVNAVLEDDVKSRGRVILPRHTRLIGGVNALHTLDRVNIAWRLAVLPEGCEFEFSGIALSADDGSGGVKGKVEKHEDSVAAQVALKSILNGAQQAAAIAVPVEGALASGFSGEANLMLDQNIAKVKSLESIYIRERTQIRVLVMRRFARDGGK